MSPPVWRTRAPSGAASDVSSDVSSHGSWIDLGSASDVERDFLAPTRLRLKNPSSAASSPAMARRCTSSSATSRANSATASDADASELEHLIEALDTENIPPDEAASTLAAVDEDCWCEFMTGHKCARCCGETSQPSWAALSHANALGYNSSRCT